jgi:serine/threonine-protein phosphatase CPPED1
MTSRRKFIKNLAASTAAVTFGGAAIGMSAKSYGNIINQIFILVFLLLTTAVAQGQTKKPGDPFFFVQFTDPQLGMFEDNKGFEKETLLLEKAVNGINRLRPDFVVITGDFVHNQKSEPQIQEFKRIVAKINSGIPVYYSPGNHDVGLNPDKQSLKKYRENYGKDRFAFQHKGSAFIGFNSSLIKARMESHEAKQYKWLDNKLKKYSNANNRILFCHYPLYNSNPEEDESYSNFSPEDRKKYLSLFENNGVDAVFFGHRHNNKELTYGNIQLITTSALGKPLGNAPSGLRIIKVYNDRIEHNYYDIDKLPESVGFE